MCMNFCCCKLIMNISEYYVSKNGIIFDDFVCVCVVLYSLALAQFTDIRSSLN
jgi:hypothetical protein